jgi:hypothetical protein
MLLGMAVTKDCPFGFGQGKRELQEAQEKFDDPSQLYRVNNPSETVRQT